MLPTGYQELEYIKSSGTQYIDTEISGNLNTSVTIKVYITNTKGNLFGFRNSASSNNISISYAAGPELMVDFNNSSYSTYRAGVNTWPSNTTLLFEASKSVRRITNLDTSTVLKSSTTECSDTITTGNLYLCQTNGSPFSTGIFYGNIYYCQIYDDTTLVRNFIPAKRTSDSVVGMYDTASNTFFTNSGTGVFTAGPEVHTALSINKQIIVTDNPEYVVPDDYTQLEYIDTDGSQSYIDTNVTIDSSNIATTKIELVNAVKSGASGGSISGTSNVTNLILWGGLTAQGSGNTRMIYYSTGTTETSTSAYATVYDFHKFIIDGPNHIYGVYDEDGTVLYENTGISYTCKGSDTFILGGFSAKGSVTCTNYAQSIKSFKMWQDGTLIRNMIPAKRNSDSVIGMYDMISNTFFTNAAGSFTAGLEASKYSESNIDKQIIVVSNPEYVIPDEYTQLEYLESSGTQYIDAELIPTSETSMEMTWCMAADFEVDNNMTGVRNRDDTTTRFGFISAYGPRGGYFYGTKSYQNATLPSTKSVWKLTPTDFYIDGSLITSHSDTLTTGTLSITLFAYNNNNGLQYQSEIIYNYKLWTGSTLVRNFIPAKRNSDSVLGMYDLVSNTFFTNAGTGTFTAGPEVSKYSELNINKQIIYI